MNTVVTTNHSLQHLWQVLDQGDLWQEGSSAERTQAALVEVDKRLAAAGGSASNYLRFLRRSAVVASAAPLAQAG